MTTKDETLSRGPLRSISSNSSYPQSSKSEDVESVVGRRVKQEAHPSPPRSRRRRPDDRNENSILTSLAHVKDEVHDFEQACHLWADNYAITKIAHGSYAAIFRLQLRSDNRKYIIAKLMPLKPKSGKGSRAADQTSIEDAATEVKALDTMSEVPGFVGFSEAWVLRGPLPALFVQQYKNWARDHPDDGFTDYTKDQLWCFIEMSDAGTDLERILQEESLRDEIYVGLSGARSLKATHCWDIFWGIAEALGRGEEFSEFEHRDLHPGNVCIIKNDAVGRSTDETSLRTKYTNLEVTLIDYTLSRATLANGEVLANQMRDKSMFEQRIENPQTQQQLTDSQQYETYRKMRRVVVELSETRCESQAWKSFVPQTNTLWLHHILSILICRIDTHSEPCAEERGSQAGTEEDRRGTKQLQHVLTAADRPTVTEEVAIGRLLRKLRDSLDPDQSKGCTWGSAKALLESELY